MEKALPCLATVTYLAAEDVGELEDWLSVLKPMCVTQMVRAPKVAKLREVRALQLTISEAHRLPFKLVPNPYCIISLNQVKSTFRLKPFSILFLKHKKIVEVQSVGRS